MSSMGSSSMNQAPHPPSGIGMNSQQSHMNTTPQSQTSNGTIKRQTVGSNMTDNSATPSTMGKS